ncbi:hypothetical protein [Cohaesibacter sp. ES.047]|uniref:hypothetical protein n=1 Tax=Cohaesibacter sp. ES.047 TaxID=1798205 RepID=UPI000BB6B228|nr:hypothetical protein [Cohaesibacter sp. ES.047]
MVLALFASLLIVQPASVMSAAAQQVHTPERGDPQRKQILNAIKPVLEVRVGKPIECVVNSTL